MIAALARFVHACEGADSQHQSGGEHYKQTSFHWNLNRYQVPGSLAVDLIGTQMNSK